MKKNADEEFWKLIEEQMVKSLNNFPKIMRDNTYGQQKHIEEKKK